MADGSEGDLYAVAKSLKLGVPIVSESLAVAELAQLASEVEKRSGAHYRMSVSKFDVADNFKTLLETTADLTKVLDAVAELEPHFISKIIAERRHAARMTRVIITTRQRAAMLSRK